MVVLISKELQIERNQGAVELCSVRSGINLDFHPVNKTNAGRRL